MRSTVRLAYEHDQYAVPRAVSRIMLAAINGKTAAVRAGLAAMPPGEAQQWSLEAMDTAAYFDQPAVVAALLDDGADPNAPVPKISFKTTGSSVVPAPHTRNVAHDPAGMAPPAIFGAIECHELAVTKLLLCRGANPNYQYMGMNPLYQYGGSPFTPLQEAVVEKDAPIVAALLDAGADVCAEDQRLINAHKKLHGRNTPDEMAYVAQREGLPPSLVRRLTCRVPQASN